MLLGLALAIPAPAKALTLYGLDHHADRTVTLDPATGALTAVGSITPVASNPSALATAPDGTLYAADTGTDLLYVVDPGTGAFSVVGSFAYGNSVLNSTISAMTFIGSVLYGFDGITDTLVTIDTSTGQATQAGAPQPVSSQYSGNRISGMAWDGTTLYGTDPTSGTVNGTWVSIDVATGTISKLGTLSVTGPEALAYDPSTDTLYLAEARFDLFYTVDRSTGTLTLVGANGGGLGPNNTAIQGMSFAVPEPAPAVTLAAGLAAFLGRRRGRTAPR